MAKLCSRCSRPAEYSLALVLSTIGISPRVQRCSPVLCSVKTVYRRSLRMNAGRSTALSNALQHAYTATTRACSERSNPGGAVSTRVVIGAGERCSTPVLDLLPPKHMLGEHMKVPDEIREMFRRQGSIGGRKRSEVLLPERRAEIAKWAAEARWRKEKRVRQRTRRKRTV